MSEAGGYVDAVLPAWEEFVAGKRRRPSGVRLQISQSWIRCRQAGVNPGNDDRHDGLGNGELQERLLDKQELIEVAKPFMANLYQFVRGSGFVVVLTDAHGYILDMLGDDDMLKGSANNNFFRGANWREEEAGTNAIGTALVLGGPIQVSGAEHYCRKHHCLTCSAAPIFDAGGRIIGILDMSGASCASHLHTLGMVAAAAAAIMAQLDVRRKHRELALTNNQLTNIFNTISDGVLMVDDRGVVGQVNPAARTILAKTEREILGMPLERVFGGNGAAARRMLETGEPYEETEMMVDTSRSMGHCFASGQPVTDGNGKVIGGVIVLRPIKQIRNLVNRFSGHHATLQFDDIVGGSVEILEAIRVATLAATTASNILLQGESGTGKEIFAQAIHNRSEQRTGPFVALNCGVIPRELIGSELFGYVEGAFTGAKKGGKPGKFELASGGTLFLDEIGDMPLEQQIALLRVLQEKRMTRIGGDKVIPVNARIICATNKNLLREVERGAFRQDLYYRLNVISITIPPLRNRVADIPLLFRHFLDKIGQDRELKLYAEPAVFERLRNFDWPGNVRELQNVVERAVSLAEAGIISLAHLPAEILAGSSPPDREAGPVLAPAFGAGLGRKGRRQLVENAERQQILLELSRCGGNVSMTARQLGVSRNTLYRKLRDYAIEN